jgi:cation-transporting ATPase 13A1
MDSYEEEVEDVGEGTSEVAGSSQQQPQHFDPGLPLEPAEHPPPDYESADEALDSDHTARPSGSARRDETRRLLNKSPPIPTYEAAVGDVAAGRGRSSTRTRPRSDS